MNILESVLYIIVLLEVVVFILITRCDHWWSLVTWGREHIQKS